MTYRVKPDLAKLRKLAGMSQQELADKGGTNRARVVYLEGGYKGSPEETARLLEILDRAIAERGELIRKTLADRQEVLEEK